MDRMLESLEPVRDLIVLDVIPTSPFVRASVSVSWFGRVTGILRAHGFERSMERFIEGDCCLHGWVHGDLTLLLRIDDRAWMDHHGWRVSAATAANA